MVRLCLLELVLMAKSDISETINQLFSDLLDVHICTKSHTSSHSSLAKKKLTGRPRKFMSSPAMDHPIRRRASTDTTEHRTNVNKMSTLSLNICSYHYTTKWLNDSRIGPGF